MWTDRYITFASYKRKFSLEIEIYELDKPSFLTQERTGLQVETKEANQASQLSDFSFQKLTYWILIRKPAYQNLYHVKSNLRPCTKVHQKPDPNDI